jgi:uncharacterized protein with PIN domain
MTARGDGTQDGAPGARLPEVELRFYEELNDFLPADQRKRTITKTILGAPSVKDVIESCGVPHPEIEIILVNGVSVGFDRHVRGGERIAVYPVFESMDISPLVRLRERPLRTVRFVVDVNLGRLARLLRLLGFDTAYDPAMDDADIARVSAAEHRVVLTRDRGLLMRRIISHGYYVRSQLPREQAVEVLARLDLTGEVRTFSRCTECNGRIVPREKGQVLQLLPQNTRRFYDEFFQCEQCGKVFWHGAHWGNLQELVQTITTRAAAPRP